MEKSQERHMSSDKGRQAGRQDLHNKEIRRRQLQEYRIHKLRHRRGPEIRIRRESQCRPHNHAFERTPHRVQIRRGIHLIDIGRDTELSPCQNRTESLCCRWKIRRHRFRVPSGC